MVLFVGSVATWLVIAATAIAEGLAGVRVLDGPGDPERDDTVW